MQQHHRNCGLLFGQAATRQRRKGGDRRSSSMTLSPLSEAARRMYRRPSVSGPFSNSRISRYSQSSTPRLVGSEELLGAAERSPGQHVLPSPLGGLWRIGPRSDEMPPARIM